MLTLSVAAAWLSFTLLAQTDSRRHTGPQLDSLDWKEI